MNDLVPNLTLNNGVEMPPTRILADANLTAE